MATRDKVRVYIAGPMGGIIDGNFPAFNAMAEKLRGHGFEVVNPAELDDPADAVPPGEICRPSTEDWRRFLKRDIPLVCECDGIVMLPGWHNSKGATLENHVAVQLGLFVLDTEELAIDRFLAMWPKEVG